MNPVEHRQARKHDNHKNETELRQALIFNAFDVAPAKQIPWSDEGTLFLKDEEDLQTR